MDFSNLELGFLDLWFGGNELSEKKRKHGLPFWGHTQKQKLSCAAHGLVSAKDGGDYAGHVHHGHFR